MKAIEKWYKELSFPAEWEAEFQAERKRLKDDFFGIPAEDMIPALSEKQDAGFNLLYCLNACETLEKRYMMKSIPRAVLLDTLHDIVIWAENYREETGRFGLTETGWIYNHLNMKLFRLGRLQFQFAEAEMDAVTCGLKKGDPVLAVHIPREDKLDYDACRNAYRTAIEFFNRYYPSYPYKAFTCGSWLLDEQLNHLLAPASNILRFQRDYDIVGSRPDNSALRYIFGDRCRNLIVDEYPACTSLQKRAVALLKDGKTFFIGYGILKKDLEGSL